MNTPAPLPYALLFASKTNPRTHFDDAKLAELADNLKRFGFLQALLVRPEWCIGCKSQKELDAAGGSKKDTSKRGFEIVDGERRYRAADIAKIDMLPCDVRELTDSAVSEIQLITFLLKEQLQPIEEAKGFQGLLKLKGEDGKALHTVDSIAERVSRTPVYIYERLKLLDLPENAREALAKGTIGSKVAMLIARVPNKEQRSEAAAAVLKGDGRGDPFTKRETEEFLQQHYMRSLGGAPFDLADETFEFKGLDHVNPKPGSCKGCPHRTGNNKELFGDVKRGDTCTHPACYQAKVDATWAKTSAQAASTGAKVLTTKESAAVFYDYNGGTDIRHDSPYVDLAAKPSFSLLKAEVDEKKVPTWRKLVEGQQVPVIVARDGSGRLRELVDRTLAMTAAKENKEPLFRAGSDASLGTDSYAKERRAEMARHKREQAVAFAVTTAVGKAIAKAKVPCPGEPDYRQFWTVLLDLAIGHAGHDGVWFLCKRDGLKPKGSQTFQQILRDKIVKLSSDAEFQAYVIELLYAQGVRHAGVKDEEILALAEIYGVDVAEISKATTEELKTAKKSKGKKGAPAGVTDPKILAEWAQAYGKGMPIEEIARSYKAPIDDVRGALEGVKPPREKKTRGRKKGAGAKAVAAVKSSAKRKAA